jgi:hypothetical protein
VLVAIVFLELRIAVENLHNVCTLAFNCCS